MMNCFKLNIMTEVYNKAIGSQICGHRDDRDEASPKGLANYLQASSLAVMVSLAVSLSLGGAGSVACTLTVAGGRAGAGANGEGGAVGGGGRVATVNAPLFTSSIALRSSLRETTPISLPMAVTYALLTPRVENNE